VVLSERYFVHIMLRADPVTSTTNTGIVAVILAGFLSCAGEVSSQEANVQAQPLVVGCVGDVPQNAVREPVEFQAGRDTIRGYIYRPANPNGAGVVLLHGTQGLRVDGPRYDPHAIQLASRGYTVLMPNYFDGTSWPRQGPSKGHMDNWASTGANAVRYLGTQTGVDPARVALWGYSFGGYAATDGSVREDAPAAVAIGVSTGKYVWEPDRGRREIPVLMIHGRADTTMTPYEMHELAGNLRRRGATVETVTVDARTHSYDGPVWCDVFQHTRRFLDVHLARPVG
jgi:dipeptidyl aminopeptidase/acylaminoacyl peptidase